VLGLSIIAFAIATLIGWSYFGEKAVVYLFGKDGINAYRLCYIIMIFVGATLSLEFVWELSDFINALIIVPNIISIIALYKKIRY
jgi:AGCS family alanine or glycine:cation symporter